MDNRIHFKAKSPVGQIKQMISNEQKKNYYSEESGGDSPDSLQQSKAVSLKGMIKADYQTDDSDSTPSNIQKKNQRILLQAPLLAQKLSKFKQQSSKPNNSGEINAEIEGKAIQIQEEEEKEQPKSVEEQSKQLQIKYKGKSPKPLGHTSMQNLHANSESETKKLNQINSKKDKIATHQFRHLIFGSISDDKIFFKHLTVCQRGLAYATHCLKGPSDKFILSKQVILPTGDKNLQKNLFLDLDETLIHACQGKEVPQVYVMAYGDNGESARIGINIRPHVDYFLSTLSKYYNIYLFTASSPAYANAIVDYIDSDSKYILGILSRLNCMETKNGFFIKDLRIIKDKKFKDMIIVDNLTHSFGFQIDNGVPILEWHNDPKDQELKYLVNYLIEASKQDDLRTFNKAKLKLNELTDFNIEEF